MTGGKINNVFTVLLYENGEATTDLITEDQSKINLKINAVTKFPLEGKIDFVVTPSEAKNFKLNFRVPGWSENFTAKVGNDSYNGTKGTVSIERKWNPGDKITVSFDMPLRLISGGISYPNAVAVKRGPQVFAIDQGLNKQLASLKNVVITKNAELADASADLPANWGWKEAYSIKMTVNNTAEKVIMVPFSEAGQKNADMEVWIRP